MIEDKLRKYLHISFKNNKQVKYICDYQAVWNRILRTARKNATEPVFFGGIVSFDDTPRRGNNARVIANSTPELFGKNFEELYRLSCENNKALLFLTAWNEWGEGAYLEPDNLNRYDYLEALKKAIEKVRRNV